VINIFQNNNFIYLVKGFTDRQIWNECLLEEKANGKVIVSLTKKKSILASLYSCSRYFSKKGIFGGHPVQSKIILRKNSNETF
jgi:hypothetical protein